MESDLHARRPRLAMAIALAGMFVSLTHDDPVYAREGSRSPSAATVDPAVTSALSAMSSYLRRVQLFHVKAVTSTDDVLNDGEKIQYNQVVALKAVKPDRLSVTVTGDDMHRLYVYDGTSFTMSGKSLNYYSTIQVPATIKDTADLLETKYGLQLPLVDLFHWGTASAAGGQITSAFDVGQETVANAICEHYAFRQTGLDRQIWIQKGESPLPLRIVMTTTSDEARPQPADRHTVSRLPSSPVEWRAGRVTPHAQVSQLPSRGKNFRALALERADQMALQ